MSPYAPEATIDLPTENEHVQDLLDTLDLQPGANHRFPDSDQITSDVQDALEAAIREATRGHIQLDGFEAHTISHQHARVKITGSFSIVEPSDDFESFAQGGGAA